MGRRALGELKASQNFTVRLTPAQAQFFEFVQRARKCGSTSDLVKAWLLEEGQKRYQDHPLFAAFLGYQRPKAAPEPAPQAAELCRGSNNAGFRPKGDRGAMREIVCWTCRRRFPVRAERGKSGILVPHTTGGVVVPGVQLAPLPRPRDTAAACRCCGCTDETPCPVPGGCARTADGYLCTVCGELLEHAEELHELGMHAAADVAARLLEDHDVPPPTSRVDEVVAFAAAKRRAARKATADREEDARSQKRSAAERTRPMFEGLPAPPPPPRPRKPAVEQPPPPAEDTQTLSLFRLLPENAKRETPVDAEKAAALARGLSPAQKSALIGYYARPRRERSREPAKGTRLALVEQQLVTSTLPEVADLTELGEIVLNHLGHGRLVDVLRLEARA